MMFMMFNNISAISWRSVLLVEELEFLEKTADLPQVTDKISSQNVLSSKHCHEGIPTHNFIGGRQ
jgi:hypothetical protein